MKFRNIYPIGNGHYKIQKYSNGKIQYYGTYKTIIEALMARDILIKDGWINPHEKNPHPHIYPVKPTEKPFRHIYPTVNGKYQLTHIVDGVLHTYGTYRTKVEALVARDKCEAENWENYIKPCHIFNYHNGKYIIMKVIDGRHEYFGIYNTLEEAEAEVEVLRSVGWDFDLWCEVDDRVDGRVVYLNKSVEA